MSQHRRHTFDIPPADAPAHRSPTWRTEPEIARHMQMALAAFFVFLILVWGAAEYFGAAAQARCTTTATAPAAK